MISVYGYFGCGGCFVLLCLGLRACLGAGVGGGGVSVCVGYLLFGWIRQCFWVWLMLFVTLIALIVL